MLAASSDVASNWGLLFSLFLSIPLPHGELQFSAARNVLPLRKVVMWIPSSGAKVTRLLLRFGLLHELLMKHSAWELVEQWGCPAYCSAGEFSTACKPEFKFHDKGSA